MIKKILLWAMLLCCMGSIFFFSSQEATESDKTSSGFITIIVKAFDFDNSLSSTEIEKISRECSTLIRKTAHFVIYALLSIIASLLLIQYKIIGWKQIIFAVIFSFLYACSDEFHQCFVSGRSGQISDVCLDTFGAVLGAYIVSLFSKRRKSDEPH